MRIELAKLKPNPFRDFLVDPIDEDQVAQLTVSIAEDGFWGGVVATDINGQYHIVAGHHRIEAAKAAGITFAELFVGEFDDAKIVEIYARENATQRGNGGTAQTGSVSAALRLVAYQQLVGVRSAQITQTSQEALQEGSKGVGRDALAKVLGSVPGLGIKKVEEQLANLKTSGHYTRIMQEVSERVEREAKAQEEVARQAAERAEREAREAEEARKAAEAEEERLRRERIEANRRAREAKEKADKLRAEEEAKRLEAERIKAAELAKLKAEQIKKAEADVKAFTEKATTASKTASAATKAAEKAEAVDVTFDLEGCAPLFKLPDHLNTFRKLVTGPSAQQYLLVKDQAALAEACIAAIQKNKREITSASIREVFNEQLLVAVKGQKKIDEREEARLQAADLHKKFGNAQDEFVRACKSLSIAASRVQRVSEELKSGGLLAKIDPDFIAELRMTHKTLTKLIEVI